MYFYTDQPTARQHIIVMCQKNVNFPAPKIYVRVRVLQTLCECFKLNGERCNAAGDRLHKRGERFLVFAVLRR